MRKPRGSAFERRGLAFERRGLAFKRRGLAFKRRGSAFERRAARCMFRPACHYAHMACRRSWPRSLIGVFAIQISVKETLNNSVRPELVEGHCLWNQWLRQAQPERIGFVQGFLKY
jgi:hypothetical protein